MNKQLFAFILIFAAMINQSSAQTCTPDATVTTAGFKVKDTCFTKNVSYNTQITLFIPDSIPNLYKIDSAEVVSMSLGATSGLTASYPNGKVIKANTPYCAVISGTAAGDAGIYSTSSTGNNKISFSVKFYKKGVATAEAPLNESILSLGGLSIKFRIVNNPSECNYGVGISSVSIDGLDRLNITPNPIKTEGKVQFESDRNANYKMMITNLVGAEVYNQNLNVVEGNNTFKFNSSDLTKGVYFLSISNGVNTVSQKFVVSE